MILASGASGHGFDSRSGPWSFEHENDDESSNVARVAQSAEHGSYEPRVAGSSPAMSKINSLIFFRFCEVDFKAFYTNTKT